MKKILIIFNNQKFDTILTINCYMIMITLYTKKSQIKMHVIKENNQTNIPTNKYDN